MDKNDANLNLNDDLKNVSIVFLQFNKYLSLILCVTFYEIKETKLKYFSLN